MAESLKTDKTSPDPNIVDPDAVPIKFVDWVIASGVGPAPGILNITLGAIDHAVPGAIGTPHAVIQTRLRMSVGTAQNIVTILRQTLDALKPPEPDQTVN